LGVDNPFSRAAGNMLRRARRDSGLTLQEAAARSNGRFAPTSIAGYERGERHISLVRFCDLADLYATPPDRLLAEILERIRPEGRRTVVIDLTRLEGLEDRDRELVAAFANSVKARRGQEDSTELVLRSGDVEALALQSRERPARLMERLSGVLAANPPADR
jgi:transcriptional regulator with XRE-family HTH domain